MGADTDGSTNSTTSTSTSAGPAGSTGGAGGTGSVVIDRSRPIVISLFDRNLLGSRPWRDRGYECHAYDGSHPPGHTVTCSGMHLHGVNLHDPSALQAAMAVHRDANVVFAMAHPPCADLSRAGARLWAAKAKADPDFQVRLVDLVKRIDRELRGFGCPFYIENPASSRLVSMWRPPDFTFDPFWFGGYLRACDPHPQFPDIIPNQDAYTKRTGLWTGGGFVGMPEQRRVEPQFKEWIVAKTNKKRRITPILFGGGREAKQARQVTARGFNEALCSYFAPSMKSTQTGTVHVL